MCFYEKGNCFKTGSAGFYETLWVLYCACCSGCYCASSHAGRPVGSRAQDDWGYGVFCNCLGNNGYFVPCKRGRDNGFNCPLVGFVPNEATGKLYGTSAGLGMALKGFSSTAFCLVAAAMFLAAAMTKTGLDKRIALMILSKVGAKANRVLLGVILCGFILSFLCRAQRRALPALSPLLWA